MSSIILLAAGCIISVALGTLYTWYVVIEEKHGTKQSLSTYEDEDGKASPAAIDAFSDFLPRLVLVISLLGAFITSIACLYGLYTWLDWTRWISVVAWLLLLLQTAALHAVRSPVIRFDIGISIACQATAVSLFSLFIYYDELWGELSFFPAVQGICGLSGALAALHLPRRPAMERDGRPIDTMFTVSAFSRYTMAWGGPLIDKAWAAQGLEYSDLSLLDSSMISTNLHQRFRTVLAGSTEKRHLFYVIFKANQRIFLRLWGITILEACATFLPQICMFKILAILEQRDSKGGSVDTTVWLWVACLGIAKMAYLGFNGWVSFIRWDIVPVTVSKQLAAVIFDKSMRMEDIKRIDSTVEAMDATASSGDTAIRAVDDELTPLLHHSSDNSKIVPETSESGAPDGDESKEGTAQNATNLLTVAIPKVARFASLSFMLLTGICETTFGVIFLILLIGAWATLAGLAIMIIIQPLNKFVQQRYGAAEDAVMDVREKKMHLVTEALHGIRMIKISAIEDQWQKTIMDAREDEVKALRRSYLWNFALDLSWGTLPIIFSSVSLAVYAYLNSGITASVAFTALAIFASLEGALLGVPLFITMGIDALVGIRRIQEHLDCRSLIEYRVPKDKVQFENAAISWPVDQERSQEAFTLRNVNLDFPNGSLSIVHGKTGCGKSLLLAAITGEAKLLSGSIGTPSQANQNFDHEDTSRDPWIIPHSMAFVAQIPWIENETIKNNILYGLPFDHDRFDTVLYASALVHDLGILPDGEHTEVGASGINLSGGQKWRITFARALYSRAGILVLDDIFSAVDAHVGRHILEYGLCGKLGAGRTRILATHHIGLVLNNASYVVDIDKSGVVRGTNAVGYSKSSSGTLTPAENSRDEVKMEGEEGEVTKKEEHVAAKFVEDEHREEGRVSLKVYGAYGVASGGILAWILIILSFFAITASQLGRSYWVEIWSLATEKTEHAFSHDANSPAGLSDEVVPHASGQDETLFYLLVYLGISLLTLVLTGVRLATVMIASLRASKALFRDLTEAVLRAKMRWLDTTPIGRILNRFAGDFEKADDEIKQSISQSLSYTFSIFGIVMASLFVSPWALLPAAILLAFCVWIARFYIQCARDLRRLQSNAKSPILDHYTSSLSGLATIRSFGKAEDYMQQFYVKLDEEARAKWYGGLVAGWMEFRQGFIGILFAVVVACGVVAIPSIGAPLAGFALGFALEYAASVVELVIKYADLELNMNAIERIKEYIDNPIEDQKGDEVPLAWPTQGRIEVQGLTVGYASDLPAVLQDVSFTVESQERVGLVGRTGSGKSSLTLAMFRMLSTRHGSIKIDGVDISTLKLQNLRSRLAIIPQDPVLFSGTLRSNIDPSDKYSDEIVFDALRRMQLLDSNNDDGAAERLTATAQEPDSIDATLANINVFRNLDYQISRGGLNLSQGQRQLICLARALISRPKVLILDEATSSVDMATDIKIQRSIREDFAGCTLLVIAHRLSTVSDFDKVLVLEAGRVEEFGPPKTLWEGKGRFFDLVQHSGEKSSIEESFGVKG